MDECLYAGSAPYYAVGRMPYPQQLADALREHLELGGQGRLLDVGCGPGPLTLLLAPLFAETGAIDADADMLAQAADRAGDTRGLTWRQLRAENLPADLGTFRVVTFPTRFTGWTSARSRWRCGRCSYPVGLGYTSRRPPIKAYPAAIRCLTRAHLAMRSRRWSPATWARYAALGEGCFLPVPRTARTR